MKTQGQEGQPQPSVVVVPAPQQNKVEGYPCKTAIKLGACQIILGILSIVCSIMAMVFESYVSFAVFQGLWFILAGTFQVMSGKKNTRCLIVTTLVFTILAAVFAFGSIVLGAIALVFSDVRGFEFGENYYDDEDYENYYDDEDYEKHLRTIVANHKEVTVRYTLNGLLIFFLLVEFIIAIIAASLTCKPICCPPKPLQGVLFTQQYAAQPGQPAVPGAPPAYTYQSADRAPPPEETKKVPNE